MLSRHRYSPLCSDTSTSLDRISLIRTPQSIDVCFTDKVGSKVVEAVMEFEPLACTWRKESGNVRSSRVIYIDFFSKLKIVIPTT